MLLAGTMRAERNVPVSADRTVHRSPTVTARKLGAFAQVQVMPRHPHRAPPDASLGPCSPPPEKELAQPPLAPCSRGPSLCWLPRPGKGWALSARVLAPGAVLDPSRPSLRQVALEESQDMSVSVSGKHPRSQQTPSHPLRRISIFMSLITPLKLLCEHKLFKKQHHTKTDFEAVGESVI